MSEPNLHQLLKTMVDKGASDLHLTVNSPPQLRIDGELVPLKTSPLDSSATRQLCYSVLTDKQKQTFEEENELDLSFGVKGLSRFRGNIFMQRGAVAGVFRAIPEETRSIEELGLPPVVGTLSDKSRGLVLVTGPTGSGKSTTLATIIDKINRERRSHIITIEDPIEYLHPHKNSLVNQREVGSDTESFSNALRYVLRQDPDVVLVGEMRDLETIEAALTISETGHLTFGTLHTNSAVQTINRIIDVFPSHQQAQVRAQLSFVLEAVVCQQLIPRAKGSGRVLATEVMFTSPAIRNLIREDKAHQIYSSMQVGQAESFMQTMNQSLARLYRRSEITYEDAMVHSTDREELESMIDGGDDGSDGRAGGRNSDIQYT
ncbi:MAG: type IV pilus twitching motility protein PilT [Bradymonadaceae bacterium]